MILFYLVSISLLRFLICVLINIIFSFTSLKIFLIAASKSLVNPTAGPSWYYFSPWERITLSYFFAYPVISVWKVDNIDNVTVKFVIFFWGLLDSCYIRQLIFLDSNCEYYLQWGMQQLLAVFAQFFFGLLRLLF